MHLGFNVIIPDGRNGFYGKMSKELLSFVSILRATITSEGNSPFKGITTLANKIPIYNCVAMGLYYVFAVTLKWDML